uniref:Uncharacterized protein n=1 Tax=Anguilla anguilla TaxID=7936 RepID=A0A0E9UN37_ANGAN
MKQLLIQNSDCDLSMQTFFDQHFLPFKCFKHKSLLLLLSFFKMFQYEIHDTSEYANYIMLFFPHEFWHISCCI